MKTLICKLLGHKWETEEHIFCKRCGLISLIIPDGIDVRDFMDKLEEYIAQLKDK